MDFLSLHHHAPAHHLPLDGGGREGVLTNAIPCGRQIAETEPSHD